MDPLWMCAALAALCFGWMHLVVFWHEHGHLLVGRMVGFKPRLVTVGKAPHVEFPWILGTRMRWGFLPSLGQVHSDDPPLDREGLSNRRWRAVAYSGGGLVFDLALIVATFLVIRASGSGWLAIPLLLHVLVALFNAIPRMVEVEGSWQSNDGAAILAGWRTKYDRAYEQVRNHFLVHLGRYGATSLSPAFDDPKALFAFFRTEHNAIRNRRGAIQEWRGFLDSTSFADIERSRILDAMVSAVLDGNLADLRVEALGWIDQAISLNPGCITLHASRASLLVRLERMEEAKVLLERILSESKEAIDQATGAIDLARIAAHGGDMADASRWLGKAKLAAGAQTTLLDQVYAASEELGVPVARQAP